MLEFVTGFNFSIFMPFSDPGEGGGGEGGKQSAGERDASLLAVLVLLPLLFVSVRFKSPLDIFMNRMITRNTIFPSQLLPKRIDWTGQEHPGTYDNLVRELYC